jgi:hypothetical protein
VSRTYSSSEWKGETLLRQSNRPLGHRLTDLAERFGPPILALLFLISTIFLMVGVVSTPWVDYLESSTTYYLGGVCDYKGCRDYSGLDSPFRDVFPATYNLVVIALALSVLEVVFLVLAIFGKRVALGILLTGVLSSAALLVAAIWFYFGVLVERSHEPWRVGGGWFAAIEVIIFLLSATIFAFFAARHSTSRPLSRPGLQS